MKKLLVTTAVLATMASPAFSYESAQAIRDNLNEVYRDLGGNFGTDTGGDEYAELLYRIDNRGDVTPLVVNVGDGVTAVDHDNDAATPDQVVALGNIYYSGGDVDGLFTLREVLDQVTTFTAAIDNDLFGDVGYTGFDLTSNNDGLAINQLESIIVDLNAANLIIADPDATHEAKVNARNDFQTSFAAKSVPFNNAVNALTNISTATISTASTHADFNGYELGATVEAAAYDDESTNNLIAGNNENGDARTYSSYVNYVQGIQTVEIVGLTVEMHDGASPGGGASQYRVTTQPITSAQWGGGFGSSAASVFTISGVRYTAVEVTHIDTFNNAGTHSSAMAVATFNGDDGSVVTRSVHRFTGNEVADVAAEVARGVR